MIFCWGGDNLDSGGVCATGGEDTPRKNFNPLRLLLTQFGTKQFLDDA